MNTLPRLARDGARPKPGIVHFGPGAFFRAFNAIYTQDAMREAGGDWGIVAVSLRSPTAKDQLVPQGCAYTSVTLGADRQKTELVQSICDVLVAPENPGAVLDALAAPDIQVLSLTITEKGYCHAPSTGHLNLEHPDIAHDLLHSDAPKSAPGFIVYGLAKRRATGAGGLTVLSCDNLPENGALTRAVILEFARSVDADLADWIAAHVTFPSTMVDRITPATQPDDIARLSAELDYLDQACVFHEPFRQWVIEDNFAGKRPAWETAGAQFVSSVTAHELMKLRCLNGTHSTLAYLGYLAGFETIAEATADADFAALCQTLWSEEIVPTVPPPEGEDLPTYCAALLERYQNPSIQHRLWQIAMDGSQKLPQRILDTIADNLAAGRVPSGLCLAVAAWMVYVGGTDESGAEIDVRDPMAERLSTAFNNVPDSHGKVAAMLKICEVFPSELAKNEAFAEAVEHALRDLMTGGARKSVHAYLEQR